MSPRKKIDLDLVRKGDEALQEARRLNPNVRMPTEEDLQEIARKPPGRPRGEEETISVACRMPVALQKRLDRYLDRLEQRTSIKAGRAAILRRALKEFLDRQEGSAEGTDTTA